MVGAVVLPRGSGWGRGGTDAVSLTPFAAKWIFTASSTPTTTRAPAMLRRTIRIIMPGDGGDWTAAGNGGEVARVRGRGQH